VFIEEAMLYGETKQMESPTSLIQKNGIEISVGDSAAPTFNTAGEVDGCIIVFRDMSKEFELEKIKDDFTFRIVHDLRSPLTVVKAVLADEDFSKQISVKPETKEGYDMLNQVTKQMLDMINELLTTVKAQKTLSDIKKVALTDIIKDIMKTLKSVAAEKGILYEYVPQLGLPMISTKNSKYINEIFTNLFTNAIKYNKEGGSITVTHEVVGDFLKTNVTDQGLGISENDLKKLTTPFIRLNEKEGATGTGLGLYIVKNLVNESSGKFEVTSKVGQGTTFSIYLPI
jgi:signal transduction histidine kinase